MPDKSFTDTGCASSKKRPAASAPAVTGIVGDGVKKPKLSESPDAADHQAAVPEPVRQSDMKGALYFGLAAHMDHDGIPFRASADLDGQVLKLRVDPDLVKTPTVKYHARERYACYMNHLIEEVPPFSRFVTCGMIADEAHGDPVSEELDKNFTYPMRVDSEVRNVHTVTVEITRYADLQLQMMFEDSAGQRKPTTQLNAIAAVEQFLARPAGRSYVHMLKGIIGESDLKSTYGTGFMLRGDYLQGLKDIVELTIENGVLTLNTEGM